MGNFELSEKIFRIFVWRKQCKSSKMKLEKYQLKAEQDLTIFEFISNGPKGKIPKLIEYTETNLKGFYNLAFGDKDEKTGLINDQIVTNNADTEKVLATVVASVFAFTDKYPDAWVYATGSTKSRTRLYRMGINKYFDEITNLFHIFGELDGNWVAFEKEIEFEGFVVKRKNIITP
jgi:hypothetical protein